MKFKTTIQHLSAIAAASVMTAACISNFEDLNTHPTDPAPDKMTTTEKTGILLPTLINLLSPQHENESQMIDQIIFGQMGGYFTCPTIWDGTNLGTYNPSDKFMQSPFNDILPTFYTNYFNIMEQTEGNGLVAILANIVRAGVMIRVADTYGPIPYSKLGKGDFNVAYDNLDVLYPAMIDDLSNAIRELGKYSGKLELIADYDVMYNGDVDKWKKYANSLKFRMAVRISNTDKLDFAKTAMQEAFDGGMLLENSDNAMIPAGDNPFYKASLSWGDLAINATLSSYMNKYWDSRISAYMLPIQSKNLQEKYDGVRLGIEGKGKVKSDTYSMPAFKQDSPMPVFYAAESYFLLAEAVMRGWITTGQSAQYYYEEGIKKSFSQWNVSLGDYMSQGSGYVTYKDPDQTAKVKGDYPASHIYAPGIGWNDGDEEEIKLQKILTQKYLANYPMGLESWSDFRRTGYPQLMAPLHNLSSGSELGTIDNLRQVRRLKYPQKEYDNNNANVTASVAENFGGQDTGNQDLWWAKKN